MTTRPGHKVVVGLDQSDAGRAAVECAADLSVRRGLPLLLVHAFEPSRYAVRPTASWAPEVEGAVRTAAERLVQDTLAGLSVSHPTLDVSTLVWPGSAVLILVEESRKAALVVVGCRGSGRFVDLVIGSTTLHVASQAHCPVLAVPAPTQGEAPRHGVVVGVDGSAVSEEAVEVAFELASELHEPLLALRAWTDPAVDGHGIMLPLVFDPTLTADEERLELAQTMAGWSAKYPDVEVSHQVVRDHPVHALVHGADRALLLVVGARGRGPVRSALLGSVSHGVLHHARGPVVVVRHES